MKLIFIEEAQAAHNLARAGVQFEIEVVADDTPVRGNALASGDDAEDKRVEDEIIERLNQGDIAAWCGVVVKAVCVIKGERFEGQASIWACSYASEEEAISSTIELYDLKGEARADLLNAMISAELRGSIGTEALALLRGFP